MGSIPNFISLLDVPGSVGMKLRSLGTDTPQQLLAQIYAAPAAFERFVGSDTIRLLERQLHEMVPDAAELIPVLPSSPLGVPLAPAPDDLAPPNGDLAERDMLFAAVECLKANHASPDRIASAEQLLDAWFAQHG